ncbi:hypothetical protein [Breoghania sp.]|uniref:hypothetical protein n=1 Tax=Breoghania sp. TaxID=2065378 RepID=UPI002AAB49D9|nr:hypothetical protein [Breoghania sp.]
MISLLVASALFGGNEQTSEEARRPADQVAFVERILRAKNDIQDAPNRLAAFHALAARDSFGPALPHVENWRGKILGIQEMQGNAAVSIDAGSFEVVAGVHLSYGLDTLISPRNTHLHAPLLVLKAGDAVTFSGNFMKMKGALVELSYTNSGSTEFPRYLFAFDTITPAQ